MKKKYEKPQIYIETFALDTTIAGTCELDTPLPSSEENCGYPIQGGTVFVEGASCQYKPQSGEYNGFCYHVPTDAKNLFNS